MNLLQQNLAVKEPLLLKYCEISAKTAFSSFYYAMQAVLYIGVSSHSKAIKKTCTFVIFVTRNPNVLLTQPQYVRGPPTLYPPPPHTHTFMPHCCVWIGRTCVQVFPRRQW